MGDMAHLAGAVIFVVGIPVEVGNDLYTQYEYRQHQQYGQQADRESFEHAEGTLPMHPNPLPIDWQESIYNLTTAGYRFSGA